LRYVQQIPWQQQLLILLLLLLLAAHVICNLASSNADVPAFSTCTLVSL
jgi:hypothetical protein